MSPRKPWCAVNRLMRKPAQAAPDWWEPQVAWQRELPSEGLRKPAEASRLEWRHCSVTWGKDGKARKMMTLTVNAILFLFGRQIFFFPIWNGLASLRSQISVFLVNILHVGESRKFPNWGRGRGHRFLREENSAFCEQVDYGVRKRLTSKMAGLTGLSWAGICYSQGNFFFLVTFLVEKTKNIASTVKIKLKSSTLKTPLSNKRHRLSIWIRMFSSWLKGEWEWGDPAVLAACSTWHRHVLSSLRRHHWPKVVSGVSLTSLILEKVRSCSFPAGSLVTLFPSGHFLSHGCQMVHGQSRKVKMKKRLRTPGCKNK